MSCCKEVKRTIKPFTGRTLRSVLIQMWEVRACAESKIGFPSNQAVLTFTFRFLSSPLFSHFLPHCFYFSGNLVGFFWEGKVFRKTFRILDLYEEKKTSRGTRFSWKFSGQCYTLFFCIFLLSLTGLSSFWHVLKDIFTLYKLAADKVGLDHYKWLRHKR